MAVETVDTAGKDGVFPAVAIPTGAGDLSTSGSQSPLASLVAGDAAHGAMPPPAARTDLTPDPAAPASTAPHAPAGAAGAQVAPVMVSLVSNAAGTHRLVLRLDPPDLGRVEIHVIRTPDSGARVEITADRPATLALLHQDEPALHQALNNAGVPMDGRSLTMQLGSPGSQETGGRGGGHRGAPLRRFGERDTSGSGLDAFLDLPAPTPRGIRAALDITA